MTYVDFLSDFFPTGSKTRNGSWSVFSLHSEHLWRDPVHPYGVGGRNCGMAPGVHPCVYVLLLCETRLLFYLFQRQFQATLVVLQIKALTAFLLQLLLILHNTEDRLY